MKLTKELLNILIEITSNSAIACFPYIGKNEKILADKAATDVMRENLNLWDQHGRDYSKKWDNFKKWYRHTSGSWIGFGDVDAW